jgi:hypothetical protein
MNPALTATQAIQSILAPAVMVSACALFLLGLNARYVAVFTRIRLLNDERRKLIADVAEHQEYSLPENDRLFSIETQLNLLLRMVWCLRSAIICQMLSAFFFVLTSCSIGLNFLLSLTLAPIVSLSLFMIGMLLTLTGIIFVGIDIFISYPLILIDVNNGQAYPRGNSCRLPR